MLATVHGHAASVHAPGDQEWSVWRDVGRRKPQRAAATGAGRHPAGDRVRPAQPAPGAPDVAALQRRANLGRGDGDAVHGHRRDHVGPEAEPTSQLLEEPGIAPGATAEAMVVTDHDLAGVKP